MSAEKSDNEKLLESYFVHSQSIFYSNIIQNLMCVDSQTITSILEVQEKKFYDNPKDEKAEFECDFNGKLLELKEMFDRHLYKSK